MFIQVDDSRKFYCINKIFLPFYTKHPFLIYIPAIPLAMIGEMYQGSSKLNLAVLLVTLAATNYALFPPKSIRPYVVIFLLLLLSIVLDVFLLLRPSVDVVLRGITVYVTIAKVLAAYQFLTSGGMRTEKAKKVLRRRFRVFSVATCEYPYDTFYYTLQLRY